MNSLPSPRFLEMLREPEQNWTTTLFKKHYPTEGKPADLSLFKKGPENVSEGDYIAETKRAAARNLLTNWKASTENNSITN